MKLYWLIQLSVYVSQCSLNTFSVLDRSPWKYSELIAFKWHGNLRKRKKIKTPKTKLSGQLSGQSEYLKSEYMISGYLISEYLIYAYMISEYLISEYLISEYVI